MKKPDHPLHQWPIERYRHASCIINGSPAVLLVFGGKDKRNKTFSDDGLWILNVNDCHWTKVTIDIIN